MHIHPRPDYQDPDRYDTIVPARPDGRGPCTNATTCSSASESPTFRRRRPDSTHDPRPQGHRSSDRTRRTIGRGLIAVGTAVAGATAELADRATDVRSAGDAPLTN